MSAPGDDAGREGDPGLPGDGLRRRRAMGSGRYDRGMGVRREVLGDAYVDSADAHTTDFTRDFQELIAEFAWGAVWGRPGLDRRSRSMIALTALIARGRDEELSVHIGAALRNGLSRDEIKEILLQTAIYCGVPDANAAFRIAQRVFDEAQKQDDSR